MTILSAIRSLNKEVFQAVQFNHKFAYHADANRYELTNGYRLVNVAYRSIAISPEGEIRPVVTLGHSGDHVVNYSKQEIKEGDYVISMKVGGGQLSASYFHIFTGGKLYPVNNLAVNQLAIKMDPKAHDWLQAPVSAPVFFTDEGYESLRRYHLDSIKAHHPMSRRERLMADLKKIDRDYRDYVNLTTLKACDKVLSRIRKHVNESLAIRSDR